MSKRILTKEKIDRQLVGQSSSTPFMTIQEEHKKRVTFYLIDGLEHKIDKFMVMMGRLVMKYDGQNSLNSEFIKPIEEEDK